MGGIFPGKLLNSHPIPNFALANRTIVEKELHQQMYYLSPVKWLCRPGDDWVHRRKKADGLAASVNPVADGMVFSCSKCPNAWSSVPESDIAHSSG
jgi:hypothetical protein